MIVFLNAFHCDRIYHLGREIQKQLPATFNEEQK